MKYLIYLIGIVSLVSCEKVIKIDLNEGSPQYVIESVILEGENDFRAKITQTTSFFDPQTPKRIENALVNIIDGEKVSHTLDYVGDGYYEIANFTAFPEKQYTLSVVVDGKDFEAKILMPKLVPIENIEVEYIDADFEDDGGRVLAVSFQDPANENNYYQVNNFHVDSAMHSFGNYFFSDFGFDGQRWKPEFP